MPRIIHYDGSLISIGAGLGLMLAAVCVLHTRPASAEPGDNWNGPACTEGSENFVTCSQEPVDPDDMGQCYVSHFVDYSPNPIQLDLIGICQAAKAALMASPDERADALLRVVGRGQDLSAEISSDPSDAQTAGTAITSVGNDLEALGGSTTVYSSSESDPDWEDVVDKLESLTSDAQVWGG